MKHVNLSDNLNEIDELDNVCVNDLDMPELFYDNGVFKYQ